VNHHSCSWWWQPVSDGYYRQSAISIAQKVGVEVVVSPFWPSGYPRRCIIVAIVDSGFRSDVVFVVVAGFLSPVAS